MPMGSQNLVGPESKLGRRCGKHPLSGSGSTHALPRRRSAPMRRLHVPARKHVFPSLTVHKPPNQTSSIQI